MFDKMRKKMCERTPSLGQYVYVYERFLRLSLRGQIKWGFLEPFRPFFRIGTQGDWHIALKTWSLFLLWPGQLFKSLYNLLIKLPIMVSVARDAEKYMSIEAKVSNKEAEENEVGKLIRNSSHIKLFVSRATSGISSVRVLFSTIARNYQNATETVQRAPGETVEKLSVDERVKVRKALAVIENCERDLNRMFAGGFWWRLFHWRGYNFRNVLKKNGVLIGDIIEDLNKNKIGPVIVLPILRRLKELADSNDVLKGKIQGKIDTLSLKAASQVQGASTVEIEQAVGANVTGILQRKVQADTGKASATLKGPPPAQQPALQPAQQQSEALAPQPALQPAQQQPPPTIVEVSKLGSSPIIVKQL